MARGVRRERSPGVGSGESMVEEGVIQNKIQNIDLEPSEAFKEALLQTQGPSLQETSAAKGKGKDTVQGSEIEEGLRTESGDVEMELINQGLELLAEGFDGEVGDEVLSFTDGEAGAETEIPEPAIEGQRKDHQSTEVNEKEELGKKQSSKKRLIKPVITTAGPSRMRMVQALTSPRKRTGAKGEIRKGEGTKQMEGKGASNPKPDLPKP